MSNMLIIVQVDLSPNYDGFVHFGDNVSLFNPELELVVSANMSESKMYDAVSIEGPCAVSGSKVIEPCVRNTFVVTRYLNIYCINYRGP